MQSGGLPGGRGTSDPLDAPDPELQGPATAKKAPGSGRGSEAVCPALSARPQLTLPPPLHPPALWKILQAGFVWSWGPSPVEGLVGPTGRCLGLSVHPGPQETSSFRKCRPVSDLELSCCVDGRPFRQRPAAGAEGAPPPGLRLSTLRPGLPSTLLWRRAQMSLVGTVTIKSLWGHSLPGSPKPYSSGDGGGRSLAEALVQRAVTSAPRG